MAKQGDWVRIHRVILPAEERTANLPEDTKKVPFEMWVKGHLLEDGEIGDEVRIKTGEGGRTFGSVSSKEIAAAFKEQFGVEIDKKKLQIGEPIRSLGFHKIPYKAHSKVTAEITVHVGEEE